MTLGRLRRGSALGVALGLVGCGYTCGELCVDLAACPGVNIVIEDCEARCELMERVNGAFGCDDEFQGMLECAGEREDLCDFTETACTSEGTVYGTCMDAYCEAHPDSDDCVNPYPGF